MNTGGIELFNRAAFFDAHEALEDVWRAAPQAEKKFLQGLIQVAVALHHYGNGNTAGARSVLRRAFPKSRPYPRILAASIGRLAALDFRVAASFGRRHSGAGAAQDLL